MAPVAHIALKMSTVQPYGSRNTPSGPQKVSHYPLSVNEGSHIHCECRSSPLLAPRYRKAIFPLIISLPGVDSVPSSSRPVRCLCFRSNCGQVSQCVAVIAYPIGCTDNVCHGRFVFFNIRVETDIELWTSTLALWRNTALHVATSTLPPKKSLARL